MGRHKADGPRGWMTSGISGNAVRCKACGRLLGVVQGGMFENKHGRQVIRTERALVVCPKCGENNAINA